VTALPSDRECRLFLSVEEFAALPEDNSTRVELQEGLRVASPRPAFGHMAVLTALVTRLHPQLPDDLIVVSEIDVDLELPTPFVRIPDLVVVHSRAAGKPGIVKASDVLLAVEVISPNSIRTDSVIKPMEYAEAGIPNLWLIDPNRPVTATVFSLVDGQYEESQRAEHTLTVDEPCRLDIDITTLLPKQFA
jgi:Uma2 family endonuclease